MCLAWVRGVLFAHVTVCTGMRYACRPRFVSAANTSETEALSPKVVLTWTNTSWLPGAKTKQAPS